MTKKHYASEHHCTSMDCLRALIWRMGYVPYTESDDGFEISVDSKCGCATVTLGKNTKILTIRNSKSIMEHANAISTK